MIYFNALCFKDFVQAEVYLGYLQSLSLELFVRLVNTFF